MTPLTLLPVLIRLLVPAGQTPPGLDLTVMAAEAQRVWSARVLVQVADPRDAGQDNAPLIWIRFADRLGPDARPDALAWTPFTDGQPGGVITIAPGRVRAAVARGLRRPAGAVDAEAFARATGRVLAHELGHVLLAEPGHTRGGLMRRGFTPIELTATSVAPFTLPPAAFTGAVATALEARRQEPASTGLAGAPQ